MDPVSVFSREASRQKKYASVQNQPNATEAFTETEMMIQWTNYAKKLEPKISDAGTYC
jgi:hypothetical protein